MKLLACLIFGVAIIQIESRALVENNNFQTEEQCVKELNLDRDEMLAVVDQNTTPTDNQKYGNFFVCLWKGRGAMTEHGFVDEEGLRHAITQIFSSIINEENAERASVIIDKITDHCKDVHELTEGETGIELKNCLMQYSKSLTIDKL